MKTNELPYQTYERITGKKWGSDPSAYKTYGVTSPAGSSAANLQLQTKLLATANTPARQDVETITNPNGTSTAIVRPKGYTASMNQPSVVTSGAASSNLNTIKSDLNNWNTGIQNQNIINAQNKANAAAQKIVTDQNKANTGAALTQAGDKTKTNMLLESLKAELAKGKTDTSNYGNEKSPSGMSKDQELEAAYQRIQAGNPSEADLANVEHAKGNGWMPSGLAPMATPTAAPTEAPKAPDNKLDRTKFDINGNPLYNEDGTPTQYKEIQDLEAERDKYDTEMDNIINGNFVLDPEEQAQVSAMRLAFDKLIDEQRVANQNFQGATARLGETSGRYRYAGEEQIGIAKDAIDQGVRKIADLEAKALSAISQLKEAFKSKDYEMISQQYDNIANTLREKRQAIIDTNNAVRQAAKDAEDAVTAKLNQQKLQADIAETTGAPLLMNALTGDQAQDQQTITNVAAAINIDPNILIGAYNTLEAKRTAEEEKAKAEANKLTKTVYKGQVTWWNAKGEKVNPDGTPISSAPKTSIPSTTSFTPTEKKKLEQAGLSKASRQNQLNFLYGKNEPIGFNEKTALSEMTQAINDVTGADRFISPQDHQLLRKQWVDAGGSSTTFDTKFRGYLNPNNPNYVTKKETKDDRIIIK